MLPFDYLRLHVKSLEPQAEVRGNAEEGLTHDNECGERSPELDRGNLARNGTSSP